MIHPRARTPTPLKLRTEVERFAAYFRREFRYDHQQFEATESPDTSWFVRYTAYLFATEKNWYPRVWVGACCFRWREYENVKARMGNAMDVVASVFSIQRHSEQGVGQISRIAGIFNNAPPHSRAMEAFLRKHSRCLGRYDLHTLSGGACYAGITQRQSSVTLSVAVRQTALQKMRVRIRI